MPVSHLTLTVSHLPTSTSFFLACLQPLGYRFIGRHDEYIGFGSKPDEPADFWLAQEKPGTPVGAAHVAFPASSKEAVNSFFVSALKAGGTIHGEPKTRDSESGYFSAAVVDIDGNSIEAVYRPDASFSSSSSRSQTGGPALKVIKNGSMVSRTRSAKSESVAPSKAATTIENIAPSVRTTYEQPVQYHPIPVPPQTDNGGTTAKAIIGTLLGATAGAAIAYAMVKGDSSSSQPPPAASQAATQFAPHQPIVSMMTPASAIQESPAYRALEAPPPRSAFTANDAISAFSRSISSRNPRADTIYEDTEYYPPITGPAGTVYSQEGSGIRRSSSGSIYATRDIPIRAIEYPPAKARSQCYPCNPSTFISSYADKSRNRELEVDGETDFGSISTVKPAKSQHSHRTPSHHSRPSAHHHHHHHSPHHSNVSRSSSHRAKAYARSVPESVHSVTRSAQDIALPESMASFSLSSTTSKKGGSISSPHHIPLPASATPSTVFLDAVDVDTHITPDDSISQVGDNHSHSASGRSRHSHRSSKSGGGGSSHASGKRSVAREDRFDDPIKPSDSISQVSIPQSRASERTVVKASVSASRAGSKAPSKTHSKSRSRVSSKH